VASPVRVICRITICLLAVALAAFLGAAGYGLVRGLLLGLFAALAVGLAGQALFALWLMVYTWDHPERMAAARGPAGFCQPRFTFTVLLPARHEEAVIGETVRKVATVRYPAELVEIRVICHASDAATIAAARMAAAEGGFTNVRVQTFTGSLVSKPRALNEGLANSANEIVCIFDAEDDIHPDIFNVVNTVMAEESVGIVQAGVQLVNFLDHWFSIHNCLEYFFWYKSRLHCHAKAGMIPLGGNTVFLRRDLVERVGGWDEVCLTEDADIGMRLSALGEPIRVVYDREWVTREETPHSVPELVRQRTRWHQGFLQVLVKGDWRRVPGFRRRAFALLTLGQPVMDAALIASLPLVAIGALLLKLPVPVALLSCMPLYVVLLQMVTTTVGARMFAHEFSLRLPFRTLIRLPVTFLPYQLLLSIGALRAVVRQLAGRNNWEKTEHLGAHRPVVAPVLHGRPVPAAPGQLAAWDVSGKSAPHAQSAVLWPEPHPEGPSC
jgi:glycosyltransferase XagB